jgi:hypothetical protein
LICFRLRSFMTDSSKRFALGPHSAVWGVQWSKTLTTYEAIEVPFPDSPKPATSELESPQSSTIDTAEHGPSFDLQAFTGFFNREYSFHLCVPLYAITCHYARPEGPCQVQISLLLWPLI